VGAAQVRGQPVEVLDIEHYLEIAREGIQPLEKRGMVLLASDNPVFRDTVSPVLTAAGYSVTTWDFLADSQSIANDGAAIDAVLVDSEIAADRRSRWIEMLSGAGLADSKLIAVLSPGVSHDRGQWMRTAQWARISDRGSILNVLAHVVDQNSDRLATGSGKELAA
jgi:two-component system chemotaxis sensor kinase CheA